MLPTHTARRRCRFSSMLALFVIGAGLWQTPARSEPVGQKEQKPVARTAGKTEPLIIRRQWKVGQTQAIRYTMQQEILQKILGENRRTKQTIGYGYKMETLSVDEAGEACVKLTYTSVLYRQEGLFGIIEYDSTKPSKASGLPIYEGYAALVGESFTMIMDAEGTVKSVEGVDTLIQHVSDKLKLVPEEERPKLRAQLKENYGDEGMGQMMKEMFTALPRTPLTIGEGWKEHISVTRGFPIVMDSVNTLEAREAGVARFRTRSLISPQPDARPVPMGPLELRYSLRGKQEKVTFVDEATSQMVRLRGSSHVSGTAIATDPSGASEPVTWPLTIHTVFTCESR